MTSEVLVIGAYGKWLIERNCAASYFAADPRLRRLRA